MKLSLIAAVAKNRVIGKNQTMPWHIPPELAYFKQKTMGHHLLMGRKTYESLPTRLEKRIYLVVSKQTTPNKSDEHWFTSIYQAINFAKRKGENELFVIGGASIFLVTIKLADLLYITQIEKEYEGDTFFPRIDSKTWKCIFFSKRYEHNGIGFRFERYKRRHSFYPENS